MACRYQLSQPSKKPTLPGCLEGHECKFNLRRRLKCPFWAAGTYKRRDSEVGCRGRPCIQSHAAQAPITQCPHRLSGRARR